MPNKSVESRVAEAIERAFVATDDLVNSRMEAANVVDVVHGVERSIRKLASAITSDASPGCDEGGGHVESLTEAVMGMTAGLHRIASAIESVTEAIHTAQG